MEGAMSLKDSAKLTIFLLILTEFIIGIIHLTYYIMGKEVCYDMYWVIPSIMFGAIMLAFIIVPIMIWWLID